MAMFGYRYLKNGILDGEQVISEEWVNESTAKHIDVEDPDTGAHWAGYGYQWWKTLPLPTFNMFYAGGIWGQYIFVIPHLNMVVVMTAQNFEDYFSTAFKILLGHIVPAVKEK